MSAKPHPVTVVVLAYNSAAYIGTCLDELARTRGVDTEVIVVDNASSDESAAIARAHETQPRVIALEQNLGCAGGNNAGWRAATQANVLFLNPDCCLAPDAIAAMARVLDEEPAVGAVGARLYYPNSHRIQHAGGRLLPNAIAEHVAEGLSVGDGQDATAVAETDADVDYVTGAALMVRRADLGALGGFDEEFYPAYYEEADLCARLRRSGLSVRYLASAVGWHHESVAVGRASPRMVRMSYRGRILYVLKNYGWGGVLGRFILAEVAWFLGPNARGHRLALARSYASGAVFALRCLARASTRPAGIARRTRH